MDKSLCPHQPRTDVSSWVAVRRSAVRNRILLFLLFLIIVLAFLRVDLPSLSTISPRIFEATSSRASPSISIVQYIHPAKLDPNHAGWYPEAARNSLWHSSEATHKIYADVWRYGHHISRQDRATVQGQHATLNSLYAFLEVMGTELARPKGADWILLTDADILILEPSIAIEYLLPPGALPLPRPSSLLPFLSRPTKVMLHPEPLIIGNLDADGLNTGAIFFRVSPTVHAFLQESLALEPEIAASLRRQPSDQYLLGYLLRLPQNAKMANAFYEIPTMWTSGFWLNATEESQLANGISWTPQLQIHLGSGRWYSSTPRWIEDVVDRADAVYDQAWALAQARSPNLEYEYSVFVSEVRKQSVCSETRQKTLHATRHYWATASGGVNHSQLASTI